MYIVSEEAYNSEQDHSDVNFFISLNKKKINQMSEYNPQFKIEKQMMIEDNLLLKPNLESQDLWRKYLNFPVNYDSLQNLKEVIFS